MLGMANDQDRTAGQADDAILVTGSLYTVGAARPVLQRIAN